MEILPCIVWFSVLSLLNIYRNNSLYPIYIGNTTEVISLLKNKNIKIYASSLQADELYHNQNYSKPCALIIGTEDKGISKEWLENSYKNVKIPMKGEIDSLNLSNAAAILIFEAVRQRNFT